MIPAKTERMAKSRALASGVLLAALLTSSTGATGNSGVFIDGAPNNTVRGTKPGGAT